MINVSKLYENPLYQEDLQAVGDLSLPWERLKGKSVLISGATGQIGSFLVDVLMRKNRTEGFGCRVTALGRNEAKGRARFGEYRNLPEFRFAVHDVNDPLPEEKAGGADYVLHLASNTHPVAYAKDPIGTITTNIIGLKNMLDYAADSHASRFLFASSNEIYGENRGDAELFDEAYCGYIDCNTMRAGYPESKRCGETLCQAYRRQKGLDVVIPRFTRSYGPTVLPADTKAVSQFMHKAAAGEDIVLKSRGMQYYSYTYIADAVSGLLTVLLCGKDGEAYNVADEGSDIRLRDLAFLIAGCTGRKVVYELPDRVEQSGYSRATKARLDGAKLRSIGWRPRYAIDAGVRRTIRIVREIGEAR